MNINTRPKVLFILHVPPPINGAAMVGKAIHESELINSAFDADYINLTTSFTLDKIGKGGISKLLTTLKIQVKVVRQLLSNNYNLCYMTLTARGAGFYKDLVVVAILKLFRKKIIYHFHNKGVSQNSNSVLNKALYRFTFNNTQSILLSPLLYADIAEYVQHNSIYFCANGIEKSKLGAVSKLRIINNSCKLLFLSNMMVAKGVWTFLEACFILKSRGIMFESHFVGDWLDITEVEFLNKVKEYNLEGYIFAHGKKYDDDKIEYFRNSEIFVHPTHNECFPLVLLEAMSYGLPIVSTYEGGIPDIVVEKETGLLVIKNDAQALATNLEILIENHSLRSRLGRGGYDRFNELYTLEKFELNFKRTIETALKNV